MFSFRKSKQANPTNYYWKWVRMCWAVVPDPHCAKGCMAHRKAVPTKYGINWWWYTHLPIDAIFMYPGEPDPYEAKYSVSVQARTRADDYHRTSPPVRYSPLTR